MANSQQLIGNTFWETLGGLTVISSYGADDHVPNFLFERSQGDPSSYIFLNLSPATPPAHIPREFINRNQKILNYELILEHIPALRDLWVELPLPCDSVAEVDLVKWQEPFRFRPKQHLYGVVIDVACLVRDSLVLNSESPVTLVINNSQYADSLSITFVRTLVRLRVCKAVMIFTDQDGPDDLFLEVSRGIATRRLTWNLAQDFDETELTCASSISTGTTVVLSEDRLMLPSRVQKLRNTTSERLIDAIVDVAYTYTVGGFYEFATPYADEGIELCITKGFVCQSQLFKLLAMRFLCASCCQDGKKALSIAGITLSKALEYENIEAQRRARYFLATAYLRLVYPAQPDQALEQLSLIPSISDPVDVADSFEVKMFDAFLHNTRAFGLYQKKMYADAHESCLRAIDELKPYAHRARARVEQGTFCYNLSQLHFAQGDYANALHWIAEAQIREPHYPDHFLVRGNYLNAVFRFDEALESYADARRLGVPTPELLISVACTQVKAQKLDLALLTLSELRERFPEAPEGFLDASSLLLELGRISEAEVVLQSSLPWHSGDARILCNLGRIFHDREQLQQAELYYEKAINIDDGIKDVWINWAALKYDRGDTITANAYIDKALQIDPLDPTALENKEFLNRKAE